MLVRRHESGLKSWWSPPTSSSHHSIRMFVCPIYGRVGRKIMDLSVSAPQFVPGAKGSPQLASLRRGCYCCLILLFLFQAGTAKAKCSVVALAHPIDFNYGFTAVDRQCLGGGLLGASIAFDLALGEGLAPEWFFHYACNHPVAVRSWTRHNIMYAEECVVGLESFIWAAIDEHFESIHFEWIYMGLSELNIVMKKA